MGVDSHAHVFSTALTLTHARRYTPEYDATLACYLGQLREHGLSHGVLVQPSFLGTDNSYLLAALQRAPAQLRGVAVVQPGIARETLHEMARCGVVGVRLNLMGKALPDFSEAGWHRLFEHLAELDWHLELHRHVDDLPRLIHSLLPFGIKIVVDHFGRPDARLGVEQSGFAQLLELGGCGQLWMKVSGVYRLDGNAEQNLAFARSAMPLLHQSFGSRRLVWGSDWPHTQHEQQVSYADTLRQLEALDCSSQQMRGLLIEAPQALFGFCRDS